jgi:hypothetical protein
MVARGRELEVKAATTELVDEGSHRALQRFDPVVSDEKRRAREQRTEGLLATPWGSGSVADSSATAESVACTRRTTSSPTRRISVFRSASSFRSSR